MKTTSDFPTLLREIPFPPKKLYYLGADITDEPKLAIVGTRKASPNGVSYAKKFASALSRAGLTIVSGLALGIDTASHEGALSAGGKTIAVLACGLNTVYPRQNMRLAKRILDSGGTLISEYPPNEPTYQSRFIARNRIVSGLSLGVLAIEAPQRSGTLATCRFAVEQNRDVFVIPGAINNPNYVGSNALIKTGATLVTEPRDILEPLGLWKESASGNGVLTPEITMDTNQKLIFALLGKNNEPMHTDEIIAEIKLNESALNEALAVLVISGIIKESGGRYFL